MNGVDQLMYKEGKFSGEKSDIVPTVQSMLDEIKPPTIVITDASDISNQKLVRYFSTTSVASSDTKRTCGARELVQGDRKILVLKR